MAEILRLYAPSDGALLKYARHVEIDKVNKTMTVDGAEFPFSVPTVGPRRPDIEYLEEPMLHAVTVTFFAEQAEIVTPNEGEA